MTEATTTAAATTTTAETTTTTTPAAFAPPAGTDAELVGHIQNHGWDKLPVDQVAMAAIKSHREASKLIGVPQDKLLRLPEANDEAGRKAMWTKLGYPGDPKEYGIEGMKRADGSALDPKLQDFMRTTFSAALLPKETAARVGSELVKFLDGQKVSEATEYAAKLQAEHEALDKNWGAAKEAKLFIAKNAAAKLGVTPEAVVALEKAVGYAKVMEMFANIGERIGEARFVANGAPGAPGNGIMSREQATARVAELKADTAWRERYLNGDAEAKREMEGLLRITTAGQKAML